VRLGYLQAGHDNPLGDQQHGARSSTSLGPEPTTVVHRVMTDAPEPSYLVESRFGDPEAEPPRWRMKKILARLGDPDAEHVDPWLTHESGWTLAVNAHGDVIWSNEELQFAPRHQLALAPSETLRLWCALAAGELDELEREPWEFGLPVARQRPLRPRRDYLQVGLLVLSLTSGVAWFGLSLFSLGRPVSVWTMLNWLANIWLPPLFIGLLSTAIVRASIGRGRRDRELRIARACAVLAGALVVALALVALASLKSDEPGFS